LEAEGIILSALRIETEFWRFVMEFKTICWECELVLTDKNGRHHSGNFDSRLTHLTPKMTIDTAYALCDNCYEQVLNKLGLEE
jgi:hypothetical protein